jgi:hypothetical protein
MSIPEVRRREIFATLVATQDSGLSVTASRAQVSNQQEISLKELQKIELEGIAADWPPLGD